MQKSKIGSAFAINFKVFYPIFILVAFVIIIIWISDKTRSCQGLDARDCVARTVGDALSSTITNKHSNYLTNGTPYTASDVVTGTQYSVGIIATTGTPRGEQVSAINPTTIRLNYRNKIFDWDYASSNGDTPAYITENRDSDFQ